MSLDDRTSRDRYHRGFVLLLVIGAVTLFAFMIRKFLVALLLAAIFSALLYPLYRRARGWPLFRRSPGLAAAALVVLALVAVVLPFAGVLTMVAVQALEVGANLAPWIRQNLPGQLSLAGSLPDWLPFRDTLEPYKDVILDKLGQAAGAAGSFIVSSGSALTLGTFSFLVNLFVMLYAMFFFLRWGPEWIDGLARYLPLTDSDRIKVLSRGLAVTRATLKSVLVIGVLQGALIGAAFWVAGIGGVLFWGTIVAVLSAIPALGPPVVWVPAAIYLLLTDRTGAGIGLAIWGTAVVGMVDNILRPRLVGGEAKMPDLLIFLSMLGGIAMFGAIGLVIGPVIAAVMMTMLDIYRHVFVQELPQQDDREP
jgi:predicted PurR-regulated permease PerM